MCLQQRQHQPKQPLKPKKQPQQHQSALNSSITLTHKDDPFYQVYEFLMDDLNVCHIKQTGTRVTKKKQHRRRQQQ